MLVSKLPTAKFLVQYSRCRRYSNLPQQVCLSRQPASLLPLLFVFLDMPLLFLAIFKQQQPIRVRNRPSKEQRALYPILDRIGKRRGVTAVNIKQFGVFFAWLNFFKKNFFCFLLHGVARFPGTQ